LVDATTLIVISTVTQTIVLTITLVVFMLQFRSQEKALKESSYQGLMGRYNDYIRSIVERPSLARLLMARIPGQKPEDVSDDEAAIYGHLLVAYGIIEEAFLLYKKGWIDEDNWLQWSAFLEAIAESPEFGRLHALTSGTFDGDFLNYVTNLLANRDKAKKLVEEKK
jgi:hypothetical protein